MRFENTFCQLKQLTSCLKIVVEKLVQLLRLGLVDRKPILNNGIEFFLFPNFNFFLFCFGVQQIGMEFYRSSLKADICAFLFVCFLFQLCHVACMIFIPQTGIEPWAMAVRLSSSNLWTIMEFLRQLFLQISVFGIFLKVHPCYHHERHKESKTSILYISFVTCSNTPYFHEKLLSSTTILSFKHQL